VNGPLWVTVIKRAVGELRQRLRASVCFEGGRAGLIYRGEGDAMRQRGAPALPQEKLC